MTSSSNFSGPSRPRQPLVIRQKSVRLGRRHTVDFSYYDNALRVAWEPSQPTGRIARKLMPAYLRARDAFLEQATAHSDATVGVLKQIAGKAD